jgi:4-hydroxybenzoate polyprenyltransferase
MAVWMTLPTWLRGIIRTMRPKQWTKNGFVFIPILFDRQFLYPEPFSRVFVAFVLFCFMSSAVYFLNDIVDIEKDKLHPKKKFRAIPSGQLPLGMAKVIAVAMPLITLAAAYLFSVPLGVVLTIYYAKDLAYSFYLKNEVILDVLTLASGFLLRVVAGAVVITVSSFSPWLYVVVGSLALFLAVGKRRQELILLAEKAGDVRATFKQYNMQLLDDMLRMVTTLSVMAYTLYTIEARTSLSGRYIMLTIPFAVYGIWRYLYLIHVKGEGSAPDEVLFKDRALLFCVILFVLCVGICIYILPYIAARIPV